MQPMYHILRGLHKEMLETDLLNARWVQLVDCFAHRTWLAMVDRQAPALALQLPGHARPRQSVHHMLLNAIGQQRLL